MKIERLKIKNFRGVGEVELDMKSPVIFLLGENGVGKSTVADALEFLFTGRCKYTSESGAGFAELLRVGAKKGEIEADVRSADDMVGKVGRAFTAKKTEFKVPGYEGPSTTQEKTFLEDMGISAQVLRASLNISRFIEREKERVNLILDAAGVKVSTGMVLSMLPEPLVEEVEKELDGIFPNGLSEVADVKKLGKWYESQRRHVNREVDTYANRVTELEKGVPIPKTPRGKTFSVEELPQVEKALGELKKKRDVVVETIGALKASGKEEEEPPGVAKSREVITSSNRVIASIEEEAKGLMKELEKVDKLEKCKMCGQTVAAAVKRKLAKGIEKRLKELDERRKDAREIIAGEEKKIEAAGKKKGKKKEEPSAEVVEKEKELEDLDERLVMGAEIVAALHEEKERIGKLEVARLALEEVEGKAERMESLVKLFRDGGVERELIIPLLERFGGVVAERMGTWGYVVEAGLDEDGVLGLKMGKEGEGLYDARLGSDSERLRLMLSILEAFCSFEGSPKVGVVDNAEILSPNNRDALGRFMKESQELFDTLVVIGTWTGKDAPKSQGWKGMTTYYWTRGGCVKVG